MPDRDPSAKPDWVDDLLRARDIRLRIRLDPKELADLVGTNRKADQIEQLHRDGFVRARLDRRGNVLVERAHYEAVCNGTYGRVSDQQPPSQPEPRILWEKMDPAPRQPKRR